MRIPRLSKNQLLQVVLILALVFNALVHLSSPAYRYYKENFENVRKSFRDFETKVKVDFVPSIFEMITNRVSASSVVTNFISSAGSFTNSVSSVASKDPIQKVELQFVYSFQDGSFYYDGFFYREGDDFFGSKITKITPTYFKTETSIYSKPLKGVKDDK